LEKEANPTVAIYLQFGEGILGINTTDKINIFLSEHRTRWFDARNGRATLGTIW
jgi:hypothetical protein